MRKNRFYTIILMIILMMPAIAEEPAPSEYFRQNKTFEELQMENINYSQAKPTQNMYKQPVSKRKIAKKFLFAMSGVAISSIILFVMLTLYNKVRATLSSPEDLNSSDDSLETPDNLQSAIQSFMNKTNWDN